MLSTERCIICLPVTLLDKRGAVDATVARLRAAKDMEYAKTLGKKLEG